MTVAAADLEVMHVLHEAFRRDLQALAAAAPGYHGTDRLHRKAVRRGWELFAVQLQRHHTMEDIHLWPALRRRLHSPDELAVLDAMEREHALLATGFAAVEEALDKDSPVALTAAVARLRTVVVGHLAHEERSALPLVAVYITAAEWDAMGEHARRDIGIRGAMDFFPWLLDGVDPELSRRVLERMIPAPVRFLHRVYWSRRYRRIRHWA